MGQGIKNGAVSVKMGRTATSPINKHPTVHPCINYEKNQEFQKLMNQPMIFLK